MAMAAERAKKAVAAKAEAKRELKRQAEEQKRQDDMKALLMQEAKELKCTIILQRFYKGWKVRHAMLQLSLLEDQVLQRPTAGPQAIERLMPSPRIRGQSDGDVEQSASTTSHTLLDQALGQQLSQRLMKVRASVRRVSTLPTLAEGIASSFKAENNQLFNELKKEGERERSHSKSGKGFGGDMTPRQGGPKPGGSSALPSSEGPAGKPKVSPLSLSFGAGSEPGSKPASRPGSARNKSLDSARGSQPNTPSKKGRTSSRGGREKDSARRDSRPESGKTSARGSEKASSRRHSRADSRDSRGSSKSSSSTKQPPEPAIDESGLAYRLGQLEKLKDNYASARAILWLMKTEGLKASHLQRICNHHRIRRKNVHARVKLRLTIVPHGESVAATSPPSSPAGARTERSHGAAARELTPEGWTQATRTGWALRLCSNFSPKLVLTGTLPCCQQTAERLKLLSDDSDDFVASGTRLEPHPEAVVCAKLDHIDVARDGEARGGDDSASLTPNIFSVAEAVAENLQKVEDPDADNDAMPPIPHVMLVANGALLELLLSCLSAGVPAEQRAPSSLGIGRLLPGDALLLESPTLFRIVGDTEEDEYVKTTSELWSEGFGRNQWRVHKHLAGDGRRFWENRPAPGGCSIPSTFDKPFRSTHDEWRGYCGEPLILSQGEFDRLRDRAGSTVTPLDKGEIAAIRPLCRDPQRRSSKPGGVSNTRSMRSQA